MTTQLTHTTILDGCIIPAHITLEDFAVIDEIPVYLLGSENGLFIATENDDLILV